MFAFGPHIGEKFKKIIRTNGCPSFSDRLNKTE